MISNHNDCKIQNINLHQETPRYFMKISNPYSLKAEENHPINIKMATTLSTVQSTQETILNDDENKLQPQDISSSVENDSATTLQTSGSIDNDEDMADMEGDHEHNDIQPGVGGDGDEKTPDHHARRPMNAFLIFCKRHRAIVREKYPNLENRSITKILGDWWANLEKDEKNCYTNLAKQVIFRKIVILKETYN